MSHRNLNNVLSLVAVALISSAIASPALANAGHHNVTGSTYVGTATVADSETSPTCYTEPSGFHTSIHWDNVCRGAQAAERMKSVNTETLKPKFVEPSGFHQNIRFN